MRGKGGKRKWMYRGGGKKWMVMVVVELMVAGRLDREENRGARKSMWRGGRQEEGRGEEAQ